MSSGATSSGQSGGAQNNATPASGRGRRVVVVGHGMVGSRLVEDLLDRIPGAHVTVLGAEDYEPYNRVLLSSVVAGSTDVASLTLPATVPGSDAVDVRRGVSAVQIDRSRRSVLADDGDSYPYDVLVLATGARARIPHVRGLEALPAGVHALRTLDDAREIVAATVNARRAVVVGGGVLGLEAAAGLARRGLAVTLVHAGPHLMDRQLDAEAAAALVRGLGALGIAHRVGARTDEVVTQDGRLRAVRLSGPVDSASSGHELLPADLLVLATGTIPEADLAGAAGLTVRRGVVVGDDGATSDPSIFAIGDCAEPPEGATGLIAQGWDQARRLARRLADSWSADESGAAGSQTGRPLPALRRPADEAPAPSRPDDQGPAPRRPGDEGPAPTRPGDEAPAPTRPADLAPAARAAAPVMPAHGTDVVRLKAHGLEVVTMGDAGEADADDARVVRLSEPRAGRHVEVVVRQGVVVAATCVGAGQVAADLVTAYTRRTPAPRDPAHLLLRPVTGSHQDGAGEPSPTLMPDRATVCRCNGVTKGDIVACWEHGARTVEDVARATRATTGCGGCTEAVCGLVDWLARSDPPGQPAAAALVAPTAAAPTEAAAPTAPAAVTAGASR